MCLSCVDQIGVSASFGIRHTSEIFELFFETSALFLVELFGDEDKEEFFCCVFVCQIIVP